VSARAKFRARDVPFIKLCSVWT